MLCQLDEPLLLWVLVADQGSGRRRRRKRGAGEGLQAHRRGVKIIRREPHPLPRP